MRTIEGNRISEYLFFNKFYFIALMLLKAVIAIMFVGLAIIGQIVIDMVNIQSTTHDFIIFIIIAVVYVIVIAVGMLLKEYLTTKFCNHCSLLLKNDYMKGIFSMNVCIYGQKETGTYLSELTNDVQLITDNYFRNSLDIIDNVVTFVCAAVYLSVLHYLMIIVMGVLLIIVLLLPLFLHKPLSKATKEYTDYLKDYTARIKEIFSGLYSVKIGGAETVYYSKIDDYHKKLIKRQNKLGFAYVLSGTLPMAVVVVLQLVSVLFAGFLALNNLLTVGMVMAVLQLGNSFFTPLSNISGQVSAIKGSKPLREQLLLMVKKSTEDDQSVKLKLEDAIRLNKVSFGYNGHKFILKDFSYSFKCNEKYLIIGESGSGKSTLLKLLAKFIIPQEGNINFDSMSYQDIQEKVLYGGALQYVEQDPFIFHDSIRNNIDLCQKGDEEQFKKVIEFCGLEDWIDSLPEGIDTVIDEEVNKISGGQKMRLALARALYYNPSVLLLDEVTSSLDKKNAEKIEEMILGLNILVIHVAHKSSERFKSSYSHILDFNNGTEQTCK